jgi:hypothetical protein
MSAPANVSCKFCGFFHYLLQEDVGFLFLDRQELIHAILATHQLMEVLPVFSESVSIG